MASGRCGSFPIASYSLQCEAVVQTLRVDEESSASVRQGGGPAAPPFGSGRVALVGYSQKKRGCLKLCGGVRTESAQFKQEVIPVKKKRAYRAKEINSVSVAQVLEDRKGQRAVVGIDVGREGLSLMLRCDDGTYAG